MIKHTYTISIFRLCAMASSFTLSESIYNPITAKGFSVMFTFQLDNTLPAPQCRNGSCRYVWTWSFVFSFCYPQFSEMLLDVCLAIIDSFRRVVRKSQNCPWMNKVQLQPLVVLGLDILILVWHPSAVGNTNKECKESLFNFELHCASWVKILRIIYKRAKVTKSVYTSASTKGDPPY